MVTGPHAGMVPEPMGLRSLVKRSRAARHAQQNGWDVEQTKNGHFRLSRGAHIVVIAGTASDWRSDRNALSKLRRCERGICQCGRNH